MEGGRININLWLNDFDNAELEGLEWTAHMEDAIDDYNAEYDTTYQYVSTISNYKSWKRQKLYSNE